MLRHICASVVTLAPLCVALAPARAAAEPVDFTSQIRPILEKRCVECHGPTKGNGGLRLHTGAGLHTEGITGKPLVPGDAKRSYLMARLRGEGGEDRMPLKGPPLTDEEMALFARWIDEGAKVPPEKPITFRPAPAGLKRLTVPQYRASLRDLLGPRVPLPDNLEPDTTISGSAVIAASRIPLSARATEQFTDASEVLARAAVADEGWRGEWLKGCDVPAPGTRVRASAQTRACAEALFTRFGRRAWRRAVTPDEKRRYLTLFARRERTAGFWPGVETLVGAILQSPHFLYRAEVGVPDPKDPTRRVLTDFEVASRLSFFLTGGAPDDALLDAAEKGRLSTEQGLRAEAERMLDLPRARDNMRSFFAELLRLGRLNRLHQFRSKFQHATDSLGPAMRTETLKVIEEVAFADDRDFREIFDTRVTYVNGELARLYGLEGPSSDKEWKRIELPAQSPRAGILGHGSFLALNAHPTASSPTRRGKFIRETLLCQAVPPPPPNISTRLPEDHDGDKPRTTRQKLDVHRNSPQCAGCHKAMDPMGLAFETFDGLGAFRTNENGLPIDSTGELDGVPFKNAAELGALLRNSPKSAVCIARHLFRFALGHLESEGEEPLMEELARGLQSDGYKFRSLVMNVVKSRGFRYVSAVGGDE